MRAGRPVLKPTRAELAARKLLADFGLRYGGEVDLDDLAWVLGVLVHSASMVGAVAQLVRHGRRAVITVSDTVTSALRWRFTVAHELGHYLLHGPRESQLSRCLDAHFDGVSTRGIEREANVFSSEFQMPKALWTGHSRVTAGDLGHVTNLAERYQVSLTAAAIRFVELCSGRCAIAFCQDGKVRWPARSARFGYRIAKGMPIDRTALAWGYLQGHPMPDWPTPVPAKAWLKTARSLRDAEVLEHCVPMPSLRAALSMVWIPPGSGL